MIRRRMADMVITLGDDGVWLAEDFREVERHEAQLLFGTAVLPTAYCWPTPAWEVVEALAKLNPGASFEVAL